MPDTTVPTGTAGSLIIRDNGTTVEYIITCSDGQTQTGALGWNGSINGTNVGGTVSFPRGAGAIQVGIWNVTATQAVLFNMFDSGTAGLGGPASVSATINRAPASTIPAQMTAPKVSEETATSMRISWDAYGPGGDGGAAVDSVLLRRYPTAAVQDNTGEVSYSVSPGPLTYVVTDLERATPYWWVTYAHNVNGYSPKSPTTPARTLGGVYASDGTTWHDVPLDVSDGVNWKPGAVAVSDGTVWKDAQ